MKRFWILKKFISSMVEKIVPLVRGFSKLLKYKDRNPPKYVMQFAIPNSKLLPIVNFMSYRISFYLMRQTIFRKAISHPYVFTCLMASINYEVIFTLLSLCWFICSNNFPFKRPMSNWTGKNNKGMPKLISPSGPNLSKRTAIIPT